MMGTDRRTAKLHWWVALVGGTGGWHWWAQVGGTAGHRVAQVGALLGTGGRS
ncbi:unnamed protein product [Staurois parvus]|uniref:Uncharacterized protein n=1 Tax=Staurois parvus TaxID=386267 RepID=A0ABN9ENQ1_9NEOB|nr:unnamed protein product [Staurois parvus]